MDILGILETFGIPVTMTIAFGYFIWKQNNWIQNELSSDLDEKHKRLEAIVVKLIDAQKVMQLQQQDIKSSYQTILKSNLFFRVTDKNFFDRLSRVSALITSKSTFVF